MTIRLAALGAAVAELPRIASKLKLPLQIVEIPESPPGAGPVPVDVLFCKAFAAAHAKRVTARLIQCTAAGVDQIELAAVPDTAWVCNVYEHEQPIAEYCLSAMLNHELAWPAMQAQFDAGPWGDVYFARERHGELSGKTLGLVGFGHIGEAIARIAHAVGMRVVAVASRARRHPRHAEWVGGPSRLHELLQASDYVVLSAPLTDATRGMMGARELEQMRRTAVLINVGRGALVDEASLYRALEAGLIGGAVLDTWFDYPKHPGDSVEPSRYPLRSLPNVVATPHLAGWSHLISERRYIRAAENVENLAAGKDLDNVVRAPLTRGGTSPR